MALASLYPPNPPDVPDHLTAPSAAHVTQTVLVLLALGSFFLSFFGLLLFCPLYGLAVVALLAWEFPSDSVWNFTRLLALLPLIPFGILNICLVKKLFTFERERKECLLEVFADEHPRLFDFIHRVCADVGAVFPEHVYLDYRVNAAALADTTAPFHLVIPTRKSLVLGLGMVNSTNLTEFKAMLAHELGHCTQKGMKINTYVHAARRLYFQVVHGEDIIDRFILGWSRLSIWLAWPAWCVLAPLWLFKKWVALLWDFVDAHALALSRQMELNADRVAVSVAGSDAPVHLLYRSCFADASFGQAVDDLRLATDHHLYTRDLFFHQNAAAKLLRNRAQDGDLGEPSAVQVFKEDDAEAWSTHPSNHEREQNAKAPYVRTEFDLRSAWLLFDDAKDVRERVTLAFYRRCLRLPKDVVLADPEEIQGFIDAEHADRTLHPRYHGLYDNRKLQLTGILELAKQTMKRPRPRAGAIARLYGAEVQRRSRLYYQRIEEVELLTAVHNGWRRPKDDELEFRTEIFAVDDAQRLLKKVDRELAQDHQWLATLDAQVFQTFFQTALHIHRAVAAELYLRYRFHLDLQDLCLELEQQVQPLRATVSALNAREKNDAAALSLCTAHETMARMLRAATGMIIPALTNLPADQALRPFLLEKELVHGPETWDEVPSDWWITRFLEQFHEMKRKLDRLHFKSLAGILALQERIGREGLDEVV